MNKSILTNSLIATILLSGCGGGGSATEQLASTKEIAQREYIFLYKHLKSDIYCKDYIQEALKHTEEAQVENLIAQPIKESTTCSVYEEENASVECMEANYDLGNVHCVFAYDTTNE